MKTGPKIHTQRVLAVLQELHLKHVDIAYALVWGRQRMSASVHNRSGGRPRRLAQYLAHISPYPEAYFYEQENI